MKTIPEREFVKIFDRVTKYVSFGRCRNPDDVKHRTRRVLKLMRRASKVAKKPHTIRKWMRYHDNLRKLYRHEFPERL